MKQGEGSARGMQRDSPKGRGFDTCGPAQPALAASTRGKLPVMLQAWECVLAVAASLPAGTGLGSRRALRERRQPSMLSVGR